MILNDRGPLIIVHCCRDWPVYGLFQWGRCGYCGTHPERTDKTVEQYMAEREVKVDEDQSSG